MRKTGCVSCWGSALPRPGWPGSAPVHGGERLGLGIIGLALAGAVPGQWIAPQISQYKGLSMALRVPGAEVVATRSSPLGQLTVVENEAVPFRHAPGLSLNATAGPPRAARAVRRRPRDRRRSRAMTGRANRLPISTSRPRRRPITFLLGPACWSSAPAAGANVLLALYHDATAIDAVEVDPAVAGLVRECFAGFAGGIYSAENVNLHIADARAFAATGEARYDLIQVPILDSFAATAGGVRGLGEKLRLHPRGVRRLPGAPGAGRQYSRSAAG